MFRNTNIIFIGFVLVSCGSAKAGRKPQSAISNSALSDKTSGQLNDQTFNINNWGFVQADRKMLTEMKHKIDALNEKSAGKVCPDNGWVQYGNSRFLIINIPTIKWSDARRTCQMLGGDLAIIRSAAENNFIFNLVKKQKIITTNGAWLGFVRKADNKFYWIDDTPLAKGYTAWGRGEPNSQSEKCGNMFGAESRAGKWNDISCDINPGNLKHAPVILCEKKAN